MPDKLITDFGSNGPRPGTAAYTAFLMAQLFPPEESDLPDDYWDNFKEALKEDNCFSEVERTIDMEP